ncbi:MAG TPA: hypothetical protein VGV89_05510 [Thermoplasmata archaeon]|nr:hypothetical protein [Thermoplasmata archaeon]
MAATEALISWLMTDADPAVRRRVRLELQGRTADDRDVEADTGALGIEGWTKSILDLQLPGGQWDNPSDAEDDLYRPKYVATNWRLIVLAEMGMTGQHPGIRRAADLLLDRWAGPNGVLGGGGSEVCITGNAVRYLYRFGYRDDARVIAGRDWLVAQQKTDGGWHCFRSADGTLDAWEGLAALAEYTVAERTPAMTRAIERGAEFFLDRELLHEGESPYAPWTRIHYPNHYYYDFLVGLDLLTRLGYGGDPRLRRALDLLESKRNPEGSWNIEADHPDLPPEIDYQVSAPYYPFVIERAGAPSRWATLNALGVLARAGRA